MTDIVKHWIRKANNDYKTGKDEMATDEPATDTICFHMQQYVEKYLKAYLVYQRVNFRKTHDIAELIELCKSKREEFDKLYELEADSLTIYAAEIRYPDDFYMPTVNETANCIDTAERVVEFVKKFLHEDGCGYISPESQQKEDIAVDKAECKDESNGQEEDTDGET